MRTENIKLHFDKHVEKEKKKKKNGDVMSHFVILDTDTANSGEFNCLAIKG